MTPQYFKGDPLELKMDAAGRRAFDITDGALDSYWTNAYTAADFLLMLYDTGRMPFSDRVPREAFVGFIRMMIPNFSVIGTFEAYLFIIQSIFGASSNVLFDVPGPGQLSMIIATPATLEFDWQGQEVGSSGYQSFGMQTSDGYDLQFRGISGIDSEPKLKQLLSELIPLGVFTSITLQFFRLSVFVGQDSVGAQDAIVDHLGNQIVFFETGA